MKVDPTQKKRDNLNLLNHVHRIEHNPYTKLVGIYLEVEGKIIHFVYGINRKEMSGEPGNGWNEGLEMYLFKYPDFMNKGLPAHFYRSYRHLDGKIPSKYKKIYDDLKKQAKHYEKIPLKTVVFKDWYQKYLPSMLKNK